MTLEEIGKELGLTHAGVRKIEQRALEKLREIPGVEDLRVFLEDDSKTDQTIYNHWR